jgi:mannose-6-phosphate isomerase-like protein (cupin superfamily)
MHLVDFKLTANGAHRAQLDNDCYVIRVSEQTMETRGCLQICPLIGEADGAKHISQYLAIIDTGTSPILAYPGSDVVLFIRSGTGVVNIGGEKFDVSPESGVCVKPGEAFQISNSQSEPVSVNISVCPPCAIPEYPEQMSNVFDANFSNRVQGADAGKREEMGDRFFQVLIDEESHSTPVTQFIGEIPLSRAAHHRHLYEETITVLSGKGYMWTDDTKTPLQAGDTIFLPLKQKHSLECTSPDGLRLVGLFYPSMSPAINY